MQLELFVDDKSVRQLTRADCDANLASILPSGWDRLRLDVKDPAGKPDFDGQFVPKFELSDDQYAKREDSVLAFKMRNKLGRFDEEAAQQRELEQREREKLQIEKASKIQIGDRCEVRVAGQPSRRGTIKFVGTTKFKPGTWVGVQYDEPLGKNDGSVAGVRYFDCQPSYGGFVRPDDVEIGDFPEEEYDLDKL